MEKKQKTYAEQYPALESVKLGNKEYTIKVNLWALNQVKKALNKPFLEIVTASEPDDVLCKLKFAIQSSFRNNETESKLITDELCENIIDENPNIYARINTNYIEASAKFYEVAKGNDSAPVMEQN
jgi:hypothetical protein